MISLKPMKKIILLLAGMALPGSAFDLPRGFFTAETLQDARSEGAAKPKMIGVLITNPEMQPT